MSTVWKRHREPSWDHCNLEELQLTFVQVLSYLKTSLCKCVDCTCITVNLDQMHFHCTEQLRSCSIMRCVIMNSLILDCHKHGAYHVVGTKYILFSTCVNVCSIFGYIIQKRGYINSTLDYLQAKCNW